MTIEPSHSNSLPNYQLTKHPVGSLREIWAIAWPLMLGLFSTSMMMFGDRLLLSRYSTAALNASATSGLAVFSILIMPLMIAGISEVFVGRNHGAGKMHEVGKPVWQMIWLSLASFPFFVLAIMLLPHLIFAGSGNEILETEYFTWLVYFGPAFCTTVALMGFFIGIGQVMSVTVCALLGNGINLLLDYLFIFGNGPFPEMGIFGAALATGISQILQTLFLGYLFLRKSNREIYGTARSGLDIQCLTEGFQLAAPAALGRLAEVIAHFVFFRIVTLSGHENLTIIAVVQSFYLLISFTVEGLSKGVSSISANLIGGHQQGLINKVLNSSFKLQMIIASIFFLIIVGFSYPLLSMFFSEKEISLLQNPDFFATARLALVWMSIFFLMDGFGWIYAGFLTASGDTKFLLYASILLNGLGYLLPAYLILAVAKGSADQGWMLIAFCAMATAIVYRWRYLSGKWKESIPKEMLTS
ncbi:MAG: MATE family efflux transporter [Parachlamydiaceae bacterium]|nr:MATE family efflux transporter [Parachlamydiaceae bacterium]